MNVAVAIFLFGLVMGCFIGCLVTAGLWWWEVNVSARDEEDMR